MASWGFAAGARTDALMDVHHVTVSAMTLLPYSESGGQLKRFGDQCHRTWSTMIHDLSYVSLILPVVNTHVIGAAAILHSDGFKLLRFETYL